MARKRRSKYPGKRLRPGKMLDRLPAALRQSEQAPAREENGVARSSIGAKLIRIMVLTSGVALVLASIALITFDYFTTREAMIRD